jgi:predicted Ser/Thr protein kinase
MYSKTDMTEPIIPLTERHPYQRLLSYPDDDPQHQLQCRLQLQQLGVECLVSAGPARLDGFPLLGVGYCGLVMAGIWQGRAAAIKLRRRSCRQADLDEEARILRQANQLQIGPQLFCQHGDLLVMERLSGQPLGRWLQKLQAEDGRKVSGMLRQLLWQGFFLDQAGIDHGALRCAAEHVFIENERLTILDFSHSSTSRRPNNLTSLVAGLLWGTRLAQDIRRFLVLPEPETLLPRLQHYKRHPERRNFQKLLQAIDLDEQGSIAGGPSSGWSQVESSA